MPGSRVGRQSKVGHDSSANLSPVHPAQPLHAAPPRAPVAQGVHGAKDDRIHIHSLFAIVAGGHVLAQVGLQDHAGGGGPGAGADWGWIM